MLSSPAGRRIPEEADVLIIGGGIVGAGVARDAAMRGLRTVLVEKGDFASGTSSRSSRLLHGGIRYLAQGRIGLVREASIEKMIIHRIAPHLAAPLPFIFPTRKNTQWKFWQLRIGVKIYDLLCGKRNLGRSSSFSRQEILKILPGLNSEGLTGAVRYFDGFTNDARLVLDTLRSASHAGTTVCNYAPLKNARRNGDAWQCEIVDHLTGAEIQVRTRSIVNASGAWAQSFPQSQVKLRLTKGVHLVIDHTRLPITDAVVMPQGSRILFAIPWGQRIILGTTDTDYPAPTDSPTCEREDIDYVLNVVNTAFPTANIIPADIISTWAGLRPLIADPHGRPSDISRKHEIKMPHPGWFDVAGGKLTTYRLMAEQTVDRIVHHTHLPAKPCTTATVPLLSPLPVPRERVRVRATSDFEDGTSYLKEPSLRPSPGVPGEGEKAENIPTMQFSGIIPPPITRGAVEHYCQNEWAIHLTDIMIRRTNWRHYHRNHLEIATQVAQWMSELLHWNDSTTQHELQSYAADAPTR